jgi:hypothetical protein
VVTDPDRDERRAIAGVLAFVLGYAACEAFHPPSLVYEPMLRAFAFGHAPSASGMAYYGALLWALVAGATAFAAAGRLRLPLRLLRAGAVPVVAAAAGFLAWSLR